MPTDIGYLLNKAARHLRLDFAARLAPMGLRPLQAAALIALGRADEGRLTPGQLAEAIDTDAPTASGLIDRLERDGWIRTQPNPADGRSRLITLTENAADALPAVQRHAHDTSSAAMDCFDAEEARVFARLLARLCEHGAATERGTR